MESIEKESEEDMTGEKTKMNDSKLYWKECRRHLYGKDISACAQWFDHGIQVTVTGGNLSHIGSVSVVDENGNLAATVFPSHKDHVIGDRWAKKLYEMYRVPVVVTAGIHYDHVDKGKIAGIVELTGEMFEELFGERLLL